MLIRLFNRLGREIGRTMTASIRPSPAEIIETAAALVREHAPAGARLSVSDATPNRYELFVETAILASLGALRPEIALTRDRERVRAYEARTAAA